MIGVDAKIEELKDLFNSHFTAIENNSYTSYGRAFLNTRDGGIIPEVLVSGNNYKDVLLDSKIDGLSFFIVDNNVTAIDDIDMETNVDIYFAVNLKTLYPSVSERAVEYLHRDVLEIISDSEFDIVSYTSGEEAFSEFALVKAGDNMQPYYLVKFSTKIEFQINENYKC